MCFLLFINILNKYRLDPDPELLPGSGSGIKSINHSGSATLVLDLLQESVPDPLHCPTV